MNQLSNGSQIILESNALEPTHWKMVKQKCFGMIKCLGKQ